jgi:hypothetical protein
MDRVRFSLGFDVHSRHVDRPNRERRIPGRTDELMNGLDRSASDRYPSLHRSSHQTDQRCVKSRINLSDV